MSKSCGCIVSHFSTSTQSCCVQLLVGKVNALLNGVLQLNDGGLEALLLVIIHLPQVEDVLHAYVPSNHTLESSYLRGLGPWA